MNRFFLEGYTLVDLEKSANQGDANAQCLLGNMYVDGTSGYLQDVRLAFAWYYKAALQGHTESQLALARMYDPSAGLKGSPNSSSDAAQAARWYGAAAKKEPLALNALFKLLGDVATKHDETEMRDVFEALLTVPTIKSSLSSLGLN